MNVEAHIRECVAPPSDMPEWKWWEENIDLGNESVVAGRYSTELMPIARFVSAHRDNPFTRRIVEMVSAQSAKTRVALNMILHDECEDPATAMWIMASADHCKEFYYKRLEPAFENCELTKDWKADGRLQLRRLLVQTPGMNLLLRGSNSRVSLQSDPVRRLYCDERREWKKGAIDLVRKRTRTFHNFLEVSMGTAGEVNDELHLDWKEGSQTFFHFNCPHCGHSQPFRFGKKESPLFPKPMERGGIVWETNEKTKPGGEWNEKEVKKTVRYECENCGHRFHNSEKLTLMKSLHEFHRNPDALPKIASLHWNALYMPWPDCDWAEIAWEFLKAVKAYHYGNIEPMIAFTTETCGEPWELRGERPKENDLRKQCGALCGDPYNRGQWVADETAARLLLVDCQALQGGHLKWSAHQLWPHGDSRLIDYGKVTGFEELRDLQRAQSIRSECVFLDSGWNTSKVYAAAFTFGWGILKSDDPKYFVTYVRNVPQRYPWKLTEIDPSLGKKGQGRSLMPLILWSMPTYLDRLLLYIAQGKGPRWLIPDDIGDDWLHEMTSMEKRRKKGSDGQEEEYWHRLHVNDWMICALQLLVVADAGGVAVSGEVADSGEEKAE
jgi:phage terminase large subunit GpA-like protein